MAFLSGFTPKGCTRGGIDSFFTAHAQMPFFPLRKGGTRGFFLIRPSWLWKKVGTSATRIRDTAKDATLMQRLEDEFGQRINLAGSEIILMMKEGR